MGFTLPLVDGIRQTETFIATSANAIRKAFEEGTKSHYAYLIMAQPLSNTQHLRNVYLCMAQITD